METGGNERTVPEMSDSGKSETEENKKSCGCACGRRGMQAITFLKSTEPPPHQYETVVRNQCQVAPGPEPFVPPWFPPIGINLDLMPIMLDHIDFSGSQGLLASDFVPLELPRYEYPTNAPSGSRPRLLARSYSSLRQARMQALNKLAMSALSGEKKLLSAVKSLDFCRVQHLLIEGGVNVNAEDSKKRTALHIATAAGDTAIMNLLLAYKADTDRQDTLGNTPLHLAVCRGDSHIVMRLLGAGANVNIRDNRGQTPLNLVWSRLKHSRKDKSISTERLALECNLIIEFLKAYNENSQNVDDLCNMMQNVSTREQVDVVMDRMADLDIAKAS